MDWYKDPRKQPAFIPYERVLPAIIDGAASFSKCLSVPGLSEVQFLGLSLLLLLNPPLPVHGACVLAGMGGDVITPLALLSPQPAGALQKPSAVLGTSAIVS